MTGWVRKTTLSAAIAGAAMVLAQAQLFPNEHVGEFDIEEDFRQYIFLEDRAPMFSFGHALAFDGDTLAAATFNSVYMYGKDENGGWKEEQVLECPGCKEVFDIALDGFTFAIDDGNTNLFIYSQNSAGVWSQVQQLDVSPANSRGRRLSMHGDHIVVGTESFRFVAGSWARNQPLQFPSDGCSDRLLQTEMDGLTLVVDMSETGMEVGENSKGACVYVFTLNANETAWELETKLDTPNGATLGQVVDWSRYIAVTQGCTSELCRCTKTLSPRVSVSADRIAVNGLQNGKNAVFIFEDKGDSRWELVSTVQDDLTGFGSGIALSGEYLLIKTTEDNLAEDLGLGTIRLFSEDPEDSSKYLFRDASISRNARRGRKFGSALALMDTGDFVFSTFGLTLLDDVTCRAVSVYPANIDIFQVSTSLSPTRSPTPPPSPRPTFGTSEFNNGPGDGNSSPAGVGLWIGVSAAVISLVVAGTIFSRKSVVGKKIAQAFREVAGGLPIGCEFHFCMSFNPVNATVSEKEEILRSRLDAKGYKVISSGSVPTSAVLVLFLAEDTFQSVSVTSDVAAAIAAKKPIFLVHEPGYRFAEEPRFHSKTSSEAKTFILALLSCRNSVPFQSTAAPDVAKVASTLASRYRSKAKYIVKGISLGDEDLENAVGHKARDEHDEW